MTRQHDSRAEPYAYRRDPRVPAFDDSGAILVFDGKCALCSGLVGFLLRADRAGKIRLLAAQTPLGEALYAHFGLKSGDYDTNILLWQGQALRKSDGSIRVFEALGFPWSLLGIARLAPRALRDFGYDLIARNRLRWFGVRAQCFTPSAADNARFVQ